MNFRVNNVFNMPFLQWAKWLIGAALAISYGLALYSVFRTHLVPAKYLAIAVPFASLIVLILLLGHFVRKLSLPKSIALLIISVLFIGINLYVYKNSSATTSFVNNIHDTNYLYEEYSIIAKTNRNINLNMSNQHMGTLETDPNTDLVKTAVANKVDVDYTDYSDLTSLTVGMDNNAIDMAAIKTPYLQLLKDNYDPFYKTVSVLDTFKIRIKNANATSETKVDVTKPFIVYISGIDTYGSISTVSRSDVNMLAVVNPKTHKILLVNTPRDYYVQLHGTTGVRDKLTHAGIYGIDMSVQTLEDLYGTDINYYLRVNFTSLVNIIDVLGGVDVYSDYTFNTFHQGYNSLDGKQALAFSRERHSFADGDRTRGKNQQKVIEAIVAKMNDPKNLVNYQAILSSLQGALQTNMSSDAITSLIKNQLNDFHAWSVESISVDGTGESAPTYSMGSIPLYVMEPDLQSVQIAQDKIRTTLQ